MNEKQKLIRASEIGEYVYCARAWWLRTEGYEPTSGHQARQSGEQWHLKHGQAVMHAQRMRRLAASAGLLAIIITIIFLLFWWRG
jgi:CRISPR/Cas system-associated exonuclease Cas4 (RecB family)